MTHKIRNMAVSVKDRLRNQAHAISANHQDLVVQHILERVLYRMSVSPYADRFVLKGAMLFPAWTDSYIRPTRDLDLCTAEGGPPSSLAKEFQEILTASVEDDGVRFDTSTLAVRPIRQDDVDMGQRVNVLAMLDTTRVKVQIDIGFGDVITPEPENLEYPSLLAFPTPYLRTCPRYTSAAEKLHAMVEIGFGSTRLKDFFDLAAMSRLLEFDGSNLARAIGNTFGQRGTTIPNDTPATLTQEYANKPESVNLWAKLTDAPAVLLHGEDLMDVLDEVGRFILPPAHTAAAGQAFNQHWPTGGPWTEASSGAVE